MAAPHPREEKMTHEHITGTEDYRTRLDILEDYASALDNYGNLEQITPDELDEIAHEVADAWPHHGYRNRVIQWLQAGSPDLDTPAVEWVEDARQLINDSDSNSAIKAIHAMLGTVLFGVALAVINDNVNPDDSPAQIREDLALTIGDHRARLRIPDGAHAHTPPYQWTLAYTYDATTRVQVEARD
jgi:hypothetical protein